MSLIGGISKALLKTLSSGEILREEFLVPLGQTQVALAAHLGVPIQRINELVRGKRGVTPETAWLLSIRIAQAATAPVT